MIKKPKKIAKKVTKKKVLKQKSKSTSKKKVVRKRKNPTDREDRIEELKVRLKEAKKEMKGDKDRDPPTYGSTLWLIMSGEITRLEHLIDDLNYMSDEEYTDLKAKSLIEKNKILLKSKKRSGLIKFDDPVSDDFHDSELEKWHNDAFNNLPSKKKNWF